MKQLYLIRHCQAEGQAPEAPLTAVGREQAVALARILAPLGVDRILSSPFRRARASAEPLAAALSLPVEVDQRLAERVLAAGELPDWLDRLRDSFADPDLALEGGESGRAAQARAVAAVTDALSHPAAKTAVLTHGNLMTLLLNHFEPRFGFAQWQGLTNPDLYRISFGQGAHRVERIWP